jgi:hypothetical protein
LPDEPGDDEGDDADHPDKDHEGAREGHEELDDVLGRKDPEIVGLPSGIRWR